MRDTGRHNVIIRLILLQHAPHRIDVIPGMPPIALGFQVAQPQFFAFSRHDPGNARADLPRDEFETAPRRFVIKKNPAARE